jgi:hypothetical protein
LRQVCFLIAALWLATTGAEGAHKHTHESHCIQCLCLPPGRRKTDLAPLDTDFFVLRSVDAKQARVYEKAKPPVAAEQVIASISEADMPTAPGPVRERRRFACPTVRLLSFVLKTGPPRAPPMNRSSS